MTDSTNKEKGYFPITSVHRDDLEAAGFDASEVSNSTMEQLAKYMCNAYLDDLFWVSLKIVAEELGIPKKEE